MQPPWMSSANVFLPHPDPSLPCLIVFYCSWTPPHRRLISADAQPKKRAPRSGALTVRKRGSCSAAFGLWVPVGFQNPRLLCVTSQDFLPPLRRFYCVKGTGIRPVFFLQ